MLQTHIFGYNFYCFYVLLWFDFNIVKMLNKGDHPKLNI